MRSHRLLPEGPGRLALPALFGMNIALLLFFLFVDYALIFHSDSAVKNLLAQEIVDTGRFFPPEWNYVNRDLWVLYNHVFIIPLLAFLPNGFQLHALAGCISAILILAGGWLFLRLLDASRTAAWAGLLVLSAGLSTQMAEHVYGQAAYGAMFWMGCFLLYGYWSQLLAVGRARLGWAALTAALAVVVCWSNPQRAVIFYVLPIAVAALTLWERDRRAGVRNPAHVRTLVLFGAACAAGVALNVLTMQNVRNVSGASAVVWRDFPGMMANVLAVLRSTIAMLDGLPHLDSKVVSPYGAYQFVRLAAALAALYLVPRAVCRLLAAAHRGQAFCAAFVGAALVLNLALLATTSLTDVQNPDGTVRYLVPALLGMLLIFTVAVVDRADGRGRRAGLLVIAVLATSAPAAYLLPYAQAGAAPTPEQRVIEFLASQRLEYGYATFWNAGKLTVLSDHRVRIRPVELRDGLPMPSNWLSSNRWYRPASHAGASFLLLKEGELAAVDQQALARGLGAPVRTLHFEDWRVIVYARNMAWLDAWDDTVRRPADYPVTASTPHQVGTLEGDALVAAPGVAGSLHFGPFRSLAPGRYQVTFDVQASGAGVADFGTVDVSARAGKQILARQALSQAGDGPVVLTFATERARDAVEFRVFTSGKGRVAMRGARIVRLPDPPLIPQQKQP